ncbi:hypothetical protein LIER_42209 [Lithospermum erythrorhizon]|uniref:Uncharacterized protein n=1 Tax=Lithospermum erythrorhizon TaxID=34254 RepID=A0AAV3RRV2_LITER
MGMTLAKLFVLLALLFPAPVPTFSRTLTNGSSIDQGVTCHGFCITLLNNCNTAWGCICGPMPGMFIAGICVDGILLPEPPKEKCLSQDDCPAIGGSASYCMRNNIEDEHGVCSKVKNP